MDFLLIAMLAAVLVPAALLGYALISGKAGNILTGSACTRREEPGAYWLHICSYLAAFAGAIGLLLAEDLERAGWAWRLLLVGFAVHPGYRLVRGWRSGTSDGPYGIARRGGRGAAYWPNLVHDAALLIASLLFAVLLRDPPPPTFYERVAPVLDDVRRRMPLGQFAPEFGNVRVNPISGAVCGEVRMSNGSFRRFYGKRDHATLDEPGMAAFDEGYADACSGAMEGPDPT